MTGRDRNTVWARAFMDELARVGVRHLCVAPGSRSTPLVLAAARDGRFRMHSVLDERSAGFFALGLGKATGGPAAVITTSGTAAANVYPAVIEAAQGEVPLLVLTADRPHRLRDSDANQAMDQLRLFGTYPRAFFEVAPPELEEAALRHLRSLPARAVAASLGPPRGPVHLNFPLDKPLEPPLPGPLEPPPPGMGESDWGILAEFAQAHPRAASGRTDGEPYVRVTRRTASPTEEEVVALRAALADARRGVIVAGPVTDPREVGPAVLRLAEASGFPVLADPLSGARFAPPGGAHVVSAYDLFLRSPAAREALAPELVLRVGASPTSAALLEYLAESAGARQVVVDEGGRWKDHLASAHDYVQASPGPLLRRLAEGLTRSPDPDWRGRWEGAEAATRAVLESPPGDPEVLLEGDVLAAVARNVPAETKLLVASSMPIRDLDAFAPAAGKPLTVFGNRGVSGIDGLISTALGIAVASGEEGGAPPTVAVLGDLAFLHDVNGLLGVRALRPRVILVVINNDGGGIFHTLPVREHEPAFTPLFATPHGLDLRKAGELYEVPWARAGTLEELSALLVEARGAEGPMIVEVPTRREETHRRRAAVVEAVVEAMEDAGVDGVDDAVTDATEEPKGS